MQEFVNNGLSPCKKSLKDKINEFIACHPLLIVIVSIFIISLLFSGCEKAYAEGMADNVRTACYGIMDTHFNNYQQYKTTIDSIMDECPYVTCNQYTIGSNTWYYMDFYNTENWGCMFSTSSSSWYGQLNRESLAFQVNNQYCVAWGLTDQYYAYDKDMKVYHMAARNNTFLFINTPNPTLDVHYSVEQYSRWYIGNLGSNSNISTVAGSYSNEYTNSTVTHISTLLDYGHIYVQTARNYGGFRYIEDTIEPITNSTDGLKVFKSSTHGSNYLYVDYSALVAVGTHTSSESSLFVTLNVDGDEYEYDFDSSDIYYHWDVATGKVYYQLPYSAIGLGDISNVTTAYVSNVQVSVAVYSQGGTEDDYDFYYLDSLYLVGSPPSTEEYDDPSVIVDPDRDVGFTDTQIQEITQILNSASTTNNFDSDKNLTGGITTPIDHSSFDTTSIYTITLHQPFFENNDQTEEGRYYLTYDHAASTWAVMYTDHYSPFEFISENDWSQYYDVVEIEVVIDMWEDDDPVFTNGASVSHSRYYYYFYSSRYLLRQMCQRELDIMTYIKLGNQISKDIWELENTRLTEIDTTLVDFATNFIPYKNSVIDFLNDINNSINSLDIDILGILRSILDALSDLHLSQLDAIDSKLTSILNAIPSGSSSVNENDTIKEAIEYYKANNTLGLPDNIVFTNNEFGTWMSGKVHSWWQDTNASNEKFEIFNGVFDTLTEMYDSMSSESEMFDSIIDYLRILSGNPIDNNNHFGHEDYLTHFFDDDFDPENSGWEVEVE